MHRIAGGLLSALTENQWFALVGDDGNRPAVVNKNIMPCDPTRSRVMCSWSEIPGLPQTCGSRVVLGRGLWLLELYGIPYNP